MRKLANELSQVSCITYLDSVELTDRLLSHDIKQCVLVACADMGANLPYVCSAPEANLLTFQNMGHRTNQFGIDTVLSETATDLVVYGHSDCEFLRFLAQPQLQNEAGQMLIRNQFKSESESLIHQYKSQVGIDEDTKWKTLSEWWVMRELKSILSNSRIGHRAESARLKLHGWVHNAEQKTLEIFDPKQQQFVVERKAWRLPQ